MKDVAIIPTPYLPANLTDRLSRKTDLRAVIPQAETGKLNWNNFPVGFVCSPDANKPFQDLGLLEIYTFPLLSLFINEILQWMGKICIVMRKVEGLYF